MLTGRGPNNQYTEEQAAEMLGVTVDRLRSLVNSHILNGETVPREDARTPLYSRSDLLVLRILATQAPSAA